MQTTARMSNPIPGWWRAAANDAQFRPAFRLTEFGLGD